MKYRIYDTGIYSKEEVSGTIEDNADRAGYDGSSYVNYFELEATDVKRNAKANTDMSPTPGNYEVPEVNFVSFEGATYLINCVMDKASPTGLTYEYNMLTQLLRLERTKGIKLIYLTNTTDTRKGIIELIGDYNASNGVFQGIGKPLVASTKYIAGRVTRISGLTDNPKSSKFKFTIEFQCCEELQD